MEWRPTLSGYTTTRNCISQSYPYEDAINSMLGFCDEVVVVDSNSTDGTWEWIWELAESHQHREVKCYKSDERVGHTILYDKGIGFTVNDTKEKSFEVCGVFKGNDAVLEMSSCASLGFTLTKINS